LGRGMRVNCSGGSCVAFGSPCNPFHSPLIGCYWRLSRRLRRPRRGFPWGKILNDQVGDCFRQPLSALSFDPPTTWTTWHAFFFFLVSPLPIFSPPPQRYFSDAPCYDRGDTQQREAPFNLSSCVLFVKSPVCPTFQSFSERKSASPLEGSFLPPFSSFFLLSRGL